ncbi:MAG TPA: glutathione S-transferase family protein [Azospirillaceae bacterium]|nr:glutathione S-transferase family protein [Azospirillaceae bacterium]
MYELIGAQGAGSAVVEAMLELSGAPYRVTEAAPWDEGPHLERLRALNPLMQVPALVLPDGAVMTESGAMLLLLADRFPAAGLVPGAGDPRRPAFLRWLFFINASLYPTFSFGDVPARWALDQASQDELRRRTDAAREEMWRQVEAAAQAPYLLGGAMTVLDLYVAVMNRWRPRRDWFARECPRLDAIARRVEADPRLAPLFERHFGG